MRKRETGQTRCSGTGLYYQRVHLPLPGLRQATLRTKREATHRVRTTCYIEMEGRLPSSHQDRHYGLVDTPVPMPQAMKISAAGAAVEMEWRSKTEIASLGRVGSSGHGRAKKTPVHIATF